MTDIIYEIRALGKSHHEWTIWYLQDGVVVDRDYSIDRLVDIGRKMRADVRRWGMQPAMRYYQTEDLVLRFVASAEL